MQSSQSDKIKDKYKILKSTGKMTTYTWTPIRLLAGFSTEILQARREWHNIFKVMKGTDLQPRILYPARLIQIWWRNQKLSRQAKVKRIQHHPTSFTNAKELFYAKNTKEGKGLQEIVQFTHRCLFATPRTSACQDSLSISNSWSLLRFISIKSVKASNHLILCHPLLLLNLK